MPNQNYIRGRRAEYRAQKSLRGLGFATIRAASSHGAYDVVGVRADCAIFIQCKQGEKPSPGEYQEIVTMPVPDGALKLVLWYSPGARCARVLYRNVDSVPLWFGAARFLDLPPKQKAFCGLC